MRILRVLLFLYPLICVGFCGYVLAERVVASAGSKVVFDGSGSYDGNGDVLSYVWNFGDGSDLCTGAVVSHVYDKEGSYFVSLVVDDGRNTSCSVDTSRVIVSVQGD